MFEDLISSERVCLLILVKIVNYIWDGVDFFVFIDEMIERMEERMDGKYFLMFCLGKIGGW